MELKRRTRLALLALQVLDSQRNPDGTPRLLTATGVADYLGITRVYAQRGLYTLVRAGLAEGVQGGRYGSGYRIVESALGMGFVQALEKLGDPIGVCKAPSASERRLMAVIGGCMAVKLEGLTLREIVRR